MVDIVIYTNPKILEEKQGFNEDYDEFCWSLSRFPLKLEKGDRIYFAVQGFVLGFFVIHNIDENDVEFFCHSWRYLKKFIPTKPFRGFRYKWWKKRK